MCGISGFWNPRNQLPQAELQEALLKTIRCLSHRGPDDEGTWVDPEAGIAFGHRRLSIIDLSAMGHQPMSSASGRFVITFNGEIYNYQELRERLIAQGYSFRGHSDTEVMLAAFTEWGIKPALQAFNGMFALAVWDRQERTLTLARDRFGEKPLYYGWFGSTLLFGSELKALTAYPAFNAEIDRNALALYLRYNYVPTPYTIYQGVYKLPPATYLTIQADTQCEQAKPVAYWSVQSVIQNSLANPFTGSAEEAADELESLLKQAIKLRMVADVPLGAFLSGGIDSSTVVALMQAQSAEPIKTYTIGFSDKRYDESENARMVAQHLGTSHTEWCITPQQALDVIPRLPMMYDEPFSDSSQIPTFLVSQLARKHVTVSLSGDGGDELFGGYNRYFWGRSVWQKTGSLPPLIKNLAAGGLTALSMDQWDKVFASLEPVLPGKLKQRTPGLKLHKLADSLRADSPRAMYLQLVSLWKQPASIVHGATEPSILLSGAGSTAIPDFTQEMMYLDTVMYLPDDILVKLDRASMAVALESRVPLLDPNLLEFAWKLPLNMKLNGVEGKWLLRQVLYRHVPRNLIERPKMGFALPIDEWLRAPLREWAEDLLAEDKLKTQGFFNSQPIRQKWSEHLSGRHNWDSYLWNILMFQAWLDTPSMSVL